jgi:hypothetical protein
MQDFFIVDNYSNRTDTNGPISFLTDALGSIVALTAEYRR